LLIVITNFATNFKLPMEKIKGLIAVFIGASSFGVLSTIVKGAYEKGYTLGNVTGIQVIFGMVILWAIYLLVYLTNRQKLNAYPRQTKIWKLIISGFCTGAVSLMYYKCVQLVPASLAIVLLMQYIWIGQLIEYIIFGAKPTKKQFVSIIIILFATVFATGFLEKDIQSISLVGIGFGLLAATAYASFIIVNGRVGNDYPPIAKSAMMVTGSCILICTIFPPTAIILGQLPNFWFYGISLSFFGTVIPPLLFAYGIPKIGISLSSILSSAELPVAISMSYFILHESVSLLQWVGVILILATVVWLNIEKKNKLAV